MSHGLNIHKHAAGTERFCACHPTITENDWPPREATQPITKSFSNTKYRLMTTTLLYNNDLLIKSAYQTTIHPTFYILSVNPLALKPTATFPPPFQHKFSRYICGRRWAGGYPYTDWRSSLVAALQTDSCHGWYYPSACLTVLICDCHSFSSHA